MRRCTFSLMLSSGRSREFTSCMWTSSWVKLALYCVLFVTFSV